VKTRALLAALALTSIGLIPAVSRTAGPTDVAGIPAAQVGDHGPTSDFLTGPLQLVGHADMTRPGAATPLGNNGGIALIGHCAFVGRWHDYSGANEIQIVDVADPTNPVVLPQTVPGSAITDAVAREIRAIDLPGFKLLTVMTFSKYLDAGLITPGQNAFHFWTFAGGDCTRPVKLATFDTRPFRGHEFFQWLDPAHTVDGHPRILEYLTTPLSGTDVVVIDASKPKKAKIIGAFQAGLIPLTLTEANLVGGVPAGYGKYTHSISISDDGKKAYISDWDGGFFTLDSSTFTTGNPLGLLRVAGLASVPLRYVKGGVGNTHSSVRVPGTKNTMVVGDEVYVTTDGCPFGWMHVIDGGGLLSKPSQLAQFRLPENRATNCGPDGLVNDRNASGLRLDGTFSMHNQTATPHYLLTSWYGGGFRVIDISDPASPRQLAAFVPEPVGAISSVPDTPAPVYGKTADEADDWQVATWSYPIVRDGLIYVADMRSGLYILRGAPGSALDAELGGIPFTEGNSNLGAFLR
jgi:LVIVD repeat-containing protein